MHHTFKEQLSELCCCYLVLPLMRSGFVCKKPVIAKDVFLCARTHASLGQGGTTGETRAVRRREALNLITLQFTSSSRKNKNKKQSNAGGTKEDLHYYYVFRIITDSLHDTTSRATKRQLILLKISTCSFLLTINSTFALSFSGAHSYDMPLLKNRNTVVHNWHPLTQ